MRYLKSTGLIHRWMHISPVLDFLNNVNTKSWHDDDVVAASKQNAKVFRYDDDNRM